ncbi:hypothetical protein CXB51_024845 [Gossypium anomalum]|uniref:RNase H type-1 domain-containing protein n=1 Tax=Gossypium anomalum TaxID=47600 RepID=A0A8J5Z290_9ROSI|nr:hypothetical protein CXB51_024845 [Gossypium anomalum]
MKVKLLAGSHCSPPEEGYVKLNTDSVVFTSRVCASIGGVIRDANGLWQCGFLISIGEGTIFQVEERAMLKGLHLAWNKGFRKLELECDNALLIEIIIAGGAVNSRLTKLRLIHHMLI